jgi:hypothetical protein
LYVAGFAATCAPVPIIFSGRYLKNREKARRLGEKNAMV